MNDNELNRLADLLHMRLFAIEAYEMSRKEQIEAIKPILQECYSTGKQVGRNQILAHFKTEIENLNSSPTG